MIVAALSMVVFGEMGTCEALTRYDYGQVHMGVRVNVSLYAHDQAEADAAAKAGYARFAELEDVMSDYRPDSEIMRACAVAGQGPIKVSRDLFIVLKRAQEVAVLSKGAFDVTCGPIVQLWRAARKSKELPDPALLDGARSRVGYALMSVDEASQSIVLTKPGMSIDLGGIAKGYACDEALRAIYAKGVDRALVEAGGDMAASGGPPNTRGWPVIVQGAPEGEVWLRRAALSTSGDAFQFVEINGKRYSHIVDPRTGVGLTDRVQVSVIAANGLTSDSLSTALSVLGEKDGGFVAYHYGAQGYFVKPKR